MQLWEFYLETQERVQTAVVNKSVGEPLKFYLIEKNNE